MTSNLRPSFLQVELLSDATFSRGEGTAAVVNTEVERDKFGTPFIGGKTVRGLLRDSWLSMAQHFPALMEAAEVILGRSQALDDSCKLRIGNAVPPVAIRSAINRAAERGKLQPTAILDGFTSIRYQTAEDRETGSPEMTTLRSSRVVLRGFVFEAELRWLYGYQPTAADLRLLAMCALATRHGGLLRSRGRGHIRMTLDGDLQTTQTHAGGKS